MAWHRSSTQSPTMRCLAFMAAIAAVLFQAPSSRGETGIANAEAPATAGTDTSQLTDDELQSLVIAVLKARLDIASNLHVVSETRNWVGAGQKPDKKHWVHRYDHKQLGESYRNDVSLQRVDASNAPIGEPMPSLSNFTAETGKAMMQGRMQKGGENQFVGRIDKAHDNVLTGYAYQAFLLDHPLRTPLSHIPYLLSCVNEWTIEREGNIVKISCPFRDIVGGEIDPDGIYRCSLAVDRGFCPIEIEELSGDHEARSKSWARVVTSVNKWQQFGGEWFPQEFTREVWCDQYTPGKRGVSEVRLLDLEIGKVTPADLVITFKEGTRVVDAINGVRYMVGDAGKPVAERALLTTAAIDEAPSQTVGLRWLTIVLNVAVVVILAAAYCWSRWYKSRTGV